MIALTIRIPESLHQNIKELARREGISVNQFIASAAGEKMASLLTLQYLRREAESGNRADFERYLAAVPDRPPDRGTSCRRTNNDRADPVGSAVRTPIGPVYRSEAVFVAAADRLTASLPATTARPRPRLRHGESAQCGFAECTLPARRRCR